MIAMESANYPVLQLVGCVAWFGWLPPQKQTFWKTIAMSLQFLGLGFPEWWGMPKQPKFFIVFYYVTIVFGPTSFFSQSYYIYIHHKELSFIEITDLFGVIMVTFVAMVRLGSALRSVYRKVMIDFMGIIHIYNYKPRNVSIDQLLIKYSRYDRYIGAIVMGVILFNGCVWLIVPIVENIMSGAFTSGGTIKLKTFIYLVMPFDFEYNLYNWFIMHLISVYLTMFGSCVIGIFDSILLCIVNHLIGRIKIMKIHFQELANNFDDFSDEELGEKLGICIRDHVLIIRFFNDMQSSHGFGVTAYYAYNLIFDSLIMVEFKYADNIRKAQYILVVIIFVGGLIAMSLIMEQIRIQSDELSNMLYFVPWERMSISNKRILLVLLARIQPILVFKAFAGLEAGIRPVINIMKSTFSYYMMFTTKLETDN